MASELLRQIPTYKHFLTDFIRSPEVGPFLHLLRDKRPMGPKMLVDVFPDYNRFVQTTEGGLIYLNDQITLPQRGKQAAFALMGLSAAGKDTVLKVASCSISGGIVRILTATDRAITNERQEQGEYHFYSTEQMQQMVDSEQLIEYVVQGNRIYGTPIASVENALSTQSPFVVWRGDVEGSVEIKRWLAQHHPNVPSVSIFVLPNMSFTQYLDRLIKKRGIEEVLKWRLKKAVRDLQRVPEVTDAVLLNPPEPNGIPTQAAAAMCEFLESLRA